MKLLGAVIIIIAVVLIYELSTVIHELGHLIMGRLTGYTFVTYRIGPFSVTKENGRLRFRNSGSIQGTAGQCIMLPPESDTPETVPVALYYFGGGLFNLLTALISLPIGLAADNRYVKAFFFLLAIVSAAQALINLIPSKTIAANDGYNMMVIRRSPADRLTLYNSLRITGRPEHSPSELPEKYYTCQEEGEYAYVSRIMRAYYLIDCRKFAEAEELLRNSTPDDKKLIDIFQLEAAAFLLLCMLMRNADAASIEKVYTDELQKYLAVAKARQIDKRLIMYAYQLLYRRDKAAAEEEYNGMMKLRNSSSSGEVKMHLALAEEVRKRAV